MEENNKYKDFKKIPINQPFNYPKDYEKIDWDKKFVPEWYLQVSQKLKKVA